MPISVDQIESALNRVLDERNRVDAETHAVHHQWVGIQIDKEQRRKAIIDGIAKTAIGGGVLAAAGWFMTHAGKMFGNGPPQ